jgi:pantoate--beta-alanine ligase
VRRSLAENDLTVVSIFVNPGQFAPHEDLTSYPRTLSRDLELLSAEKVTVSNLPSSAIPISRTPSAVFVPSVSEIYPSGIVQNIAEQKGTFVEVKGYSHQMEGQSRPTFFRGVATVVTKLFNVIQVSIYLSIYSIHDYTSLFLPTPYSSLQTLTLAKKIYNRHYSLSVSVETCYSPTPSQIIFA